eukprot:3524379-Amphidinium_carterae.1
MQATDVQVVPSSHSAFEESTHRVMFALTRCTSSSHLRLSSPACIPKNCIVFSRDAAGVEGIAVMSGSDYDGDAP